MRSNFFVFLLPASFVGVSVVLAATSLLLGDGKISNNPRVGYIYSCQQNFNPNAPGSHAKGAWLGDTSWNPDIKPTVDGEILVGGYGMRMRIQGNRRVIESDGMPQHPTGAFPISRWDDAYQYDRNPGHISAQNVNLEFPVIPDIAARASCVPMGMIGVALTGAAFYNALDARGRDAPAHEIQDKCGGHPQQHGQYHYHGPAPCVQEQDVLRKGGKLVHSGLVGYALDGFGIFGNIGKGGKALHNDDLDECHGHVETVIWDGKEQEIYHYHLTDAYPYSVGCFRGTPVSTGRLGGNDGQGRMPAMQRGERVGPGGNMPGGDVEDRMRAAARKLGVSADALRRALGPPPPDFRRASQQLGISEQKLREALPPPQGR